MTLVFRNDPLESLTVSSTFDSIQFVRDYLQRTIEQQLRNLMMDELPAIIHRLSLELWCPEQANRGSQTPQEDVDEKGADPFASPPLDPVDANGNLLDYNSVSELSLNGGGEAQSFFSQKNLLRLASLTDSHRTLSLFTPGIKDVVFRAWSGFGERLESASSPPFATPSLAKSYSGPAGGSTTYTFSDSGSTAHGYFPSRPSLVSLNSAAGSIAHGAGHRSRPGRKKKTRVVNLRKAKSEAGASEGPSEDTSDTASVNVPASEPIMCPSIPEEPASEDGRAQDTSPSRVRFRPSSAGNGAPSGPPLLSDLYVAAKSGQAAAAAASPVEAPSTRSSSLAFDMMTEKAPLDRFGRPSSSSFRDQHQASGSSDTSSVILEQAWIMKMAGEIARRVYDEKQRRQDVWEQPDIAPPPTYEAATH